MVMCFLGEVRIQTKNQAKPTNTAQSGAKQAGREEWGFRHEGGSKLVAKAPNLGVDIRRKTQIYREK